VKCSDRALKQKALGFITLADHCYALCRRLSAENFGDGVVNDFDLPGV
jgi:hypothetical protein